MNQDNTQRTAPMHPDPGARLIADRYAIVGELGRGGMGVVWRAEDRVIGRPVAIKELRLGSLGAAAEDAEVFQERVLREVRSGGRLNDAAVVTVYDVVHEGDSTFIVMELVEAPTLAQLVERYGPLPPQQVAAIGEQVLSALRAAHEMGIVHRDVKPANIMVAANGRVKLTDFGIAQAVDDPRLTTSGAIAGSPAFIAPERVEGKQATPASDLWSLGVTLYLAAEGAAPFARPTTAAVLHAILSDVPVLSRVQGPLASAIMGMLIRSPESRIQPAQAQALLRQVSAGPAAAPGATALYAGGLPPTMHANQAPTRFAGSRPRRRGLLAGVLALVAVLALAGGFFLGRWYAAPATDPAMAPTLSYGPDAVQFDDSGSSDCYIGQLVPGRTIGSDASVDCTKPHDFEVIGTYTVLGSDSSDATLAGYPDPAQLQGYAQARCRLTFYSNGVKAADRPNLSYRALVPTKQAWDTTPSDSSGNLTRSAYCVVSRRDNGQLNDSVSVAVK